MECGWLPATDAPLQFAPGFEAARYLRAGLRVDDRRVDAARGDDLRVRQATGSITALALERRRVEPARRRVGDEAVLQPVERVAGLERGLVKHLDICRPE